MTSRSQQLAICCLVVGVTLGTVGRAAERAKVDLSISVGMTPATFTPGGHNAFSVTVHNAGPDDAGASRPYDQPIAVYGSSIVFPPDQLPPLDISYTVEGGCYLFRFSEPLPDGNWVVQFSYRLDPIPAGQSRTCTSTIVFSPSASTDIPTNWRVNALVDDDINPDNNRVDYTFVAASPAPPISVPSGSPSAWLVLSFGLLLVASMTQRREAS